jgi:hypothetical protein
MFGLDRLIGDLQALGFEGVERMTGNAGTMFAVIRSYIVPAGQFLGRVIDLAIPVPADYPNSFGSSIHIRANPQLFECGSVANARNIKTSELGGGWRYWSKNFNGSRGTGDRDTRRLLSQINEVFLHA